MTIARIAALSSLLALTGCCAVDGSGVYAEQRRSLPAFDQLSISGGLHADIVAGPAGDVIVRGDDNLLQHIVTEVVGGRLEVWPDSWFVDSLDSTGVAFTVPGLRSIEASGGSSVRSLDMAVASLSVEASGGSRALLTGQATRLDLEASGGSGIDARDLLAETVTLDVSGGSGARVNATNQVSGDASGGSNVYVQGTATVDIDSSGGSTISRQ